MKPGLCAVICVLSIAALLMLGPSHYVASQSSHSVVSGVSKYPPCYVTTATVTPCKATSGVLQRIVLGTEVAGATIKLFDLAPAACVGIPATNPRGVLYIPSWEEGFMIGPRSIEYNLKLVNGLCILTDSATDLLFVME